MSEHAHCPRCGVTVPISAAPTVYPPAAICSDCGTIYRRGVPGLTEAYDPGRHLAPADALDLSAPALPRRSARPFRVE